MGWRLIIKLEQDWPLPSFIQHGPISGILCGWQSYGKSCSLDSWQLRIQLHFRLIHSEGNWHPYRWSSLKTKDRKNSMDLKNCSLSVCLGDVNHYVYKVNLTLMFMANPVCTVFKFMSHQSFILKKVLKPCGKVVFLLGIL